MQQETDFGGGRVPDAGFADYFGGGWGVGVGVGVGIGVGILGGGREEDDGEVEGAVCGGGEHGVEVFGRLVHAGVGGAGPVAVSVPY